MKTTRAVALTIALFSPLFLTPAAQAADLPSSAFGTRPLEQPLTLPQGEATGSFYTREGILYGPDGKQFIPQGMNVGTTGNFDWGGPAVGTGGDALGHSSDALAWGMNTVRLNVYATDAYWYTLRGKGMPLSTMLDTYQKVIDEYTAKGIVVLIEAHDPVTDGKNLPRQDSLRGQLDEFYAAAAKRWGGNPYVWFGTPNEPNVRNAEWRDLMGRYIGKIREQGARNIISVNTPTWGQDLGTTEASSTKFSYEKDMMPVLNTTAYPDGKGGTITGNLLTEQHNYGGKCEAPLYATSDAMRTYIAKVKAGGGLPGGGTPVIFGEFGYDVKDNRPLDAPDPKDIWGGTAWKTWTCSFDTEKRASNNTLNSAKALGAGLLMWHGTFGGDGRSPKATGHPFWSDGGPGAGLSAQGTHLWNLLHGAKATSKVEEGKDGALRWTVIAQDLLAEGTNLPSAGVARVDFYAGGTLLKASSNAGGGASYVVTEEFPRSALQGPLMAAVYDTAGNVTTVKAEPVASYTVASTGYGSTSFGFQASGLPTGGKMKITWRREGTAQVATTTQRTWWSGSSQAGWSDAKAEVLDPSGRVVASSPLLKATPTYTVTSTGASAASFGFKANALPPQGTMRITWQKNGVQQATETSNLTWWSGPQAGWKNAQAVVLDSSRRVVASSPLLNP